MPTSRTIHQAPRRAARPGETVVTNTCGHNCSGRCMPGRDVRQIEPVCHPDRLRYPMRRVGPCSSG